MKKILFILVAFLIVVLVGSAVMYWITPADKLPPYVPGYEPGHHAVHFKHGLAALILALFGGAYLWFSSKPSDAKQ